MPNKRTTRRHQIRQRRKRRFKRQKLAKKQAAKA